MFSLFLNKLGFFKFSIQRQIFLALVMMSVFTSIILGVIGYGVSRKTIEDQYYKDHENSVGIASEVVSLSLRNDIERARSLLSSNFFLTNLAKENEGSSTFSAAVNKNIQDYILDIVSSNNEIRDVLVVNLAGNISFASQNDINQRFIRHYYNGDNILEESWIEDSRNQKGKEVFYSKNVIFSDENETFSLVKEIIDPSSFKEAGFLVMNIRKEAALSGAFAGKDEGYGTDYKMIVAKKPNGKPGYELVYATSDLIKKQFDEVVNEYFSDKNDTYKKYIFAGRHNSVSDWEIVNVITKREIADLSNYIAIASIIIGIILVLLSLPLSSLISGYITEPLYMLEESIKTLGEGIYHIDTEFDDSETGRIGQKFKNVVNNNLELQNKLIQTNLKEREAELLLMQSQINPHYLYNTLDTLYMMAIIKNEDEIAGFVQALSENFRLSLNKGNKLIMVQDEIKRIQAYMKIQNYRFKDKYKLEIDINAELLRERILTFILQPLVENAVFHGLEPKATEGKVTISGELKQREMVFVVSDDGVGIENMDTLMNGYGVKNIVERMKLFYGDEYFPIFENTYPGTKVTITVPRLTTEEMMAKGLIEGEK